MKWNEKEINDLIENYPKHGLQYCVNLIGRSKVSIRKMVERLKLRTKNENYKYETFEILVSGSKSYSEIARKLSITNSAGNRQTIKKYIEKYNLDTSHFDNGVSNIFRPRNKKELSEILVENSEYIYTTILKERLYDKNLKERKCELCGQGEEWMGKKMSLILDHRNGKNNDNRIENLRIVCPNCNATLDTHGGKNIKNK